MTADRSREPVFIHSLFRAGSTYIFDVFRRSPAGYYCYQEPHNEILLNASRDPEKLLEFHTDTSEILRHPSLQRPYFWEFYVISEVVGKHFRKEFCYDDFFASEPGTSDEINVYFKALIDNAKGKPLFQCCRTIGRIGRMRADLDGKHGYLWRDPWDQWWSYKVAGYFDVVNLLILNAGNAPSPFQQLRSEFQVGEFHSQDVSQEFRHFEKRRLNPDQSYTLFYALWCYGFIQSRANADIRISIDSLSNSPSYRKDVVTKLEALGIEGLDFSDCRIPQGCYTQKEARFFRNIEERVHAVLLRHGYGANDVEELISARSEHAPQFQKGAGAGRKAPTGIMQEAAERARAVAQRSENDAAFLCRQMLASEAEAAQEKEHLKRVEDLRAELEQRLTAQRVESERQLAEANSRLADVRGELEQRLTAQRVESERQLAEANSRLADVRGELEQRLSAALRAHQQAQALADARGYELGSVYASRSWRMTKPLRKTKTLLVRWMKRIGTYFTPLW